MYQGNRIKFHRGKTASAQKYKELEKTTKQKPILQIAQVFRAIRRIAPTLFFVSFVTSWFKSFWCDDPAQCIAPNQVPPHKVGRGLGRGKSVYSTSSSEIMPSPKT